MAFALWLTVVALPILVLDNVPRTDARAAPFADPKPVATVHTADPPVIVLTPTPDALESPESTTETTVAAPPATDPPSTTSTTAPRAARAPATTTTEAPAASDSGSGNAETGGASWYDYRSGECAHKTIPKGTVVTVTNLANGATTTCTVTDRGPYSGSRIIDLDRGTFAEIADPGSGVIQVQITW